MAVFQAGIGCTAPLGNNPNAEYGIQFGYPLGPSADPTYAYIQNQGPFGGAVTCSYANYAINDSDPRTYLFAPGLVGRNESCITFGSRIDAEPFRNIIIPPLKSYQPGVGNGNADIWKVTCLWTGDPSSSTNCFANENSIAVVPGEYPKNFTLLDCNGQWATPQGAFRPGTSRRCYNTAVGSSTGVSNLVCSWVIRRDDITNNIFVVFGDDGTGALCNLPQGGALDTFPQSCQIVIEQMPDDWDPSRGNFLNDPDVPNLPLLQ